MDFPARALSARPLVIAHRGNSSAAPENTLAAVAAAVRANADYVEIDVRITADDVPMVIHDATVDRTTNGTGAVAELTAAELGELDAGSWFRPDPDGRQPFAGERVPSLAEVLDLLADTSTALLLEVKPGASGEQTGMVVRQVLDRELTDRVVVQSYDEQVLAQVRQHHPVLALGLLRNAIDDEPIAAVRQVDAVAYNPNAWALVDRPEVVGDLRQAGVMVMSHTVDAPERWQALTELHVGGIITNRPGELREWQHIRHPEKVLSAH